MTELGVIGGTGLTSLSDLDAIRRETVDTPYGEPSGPLVHGLFCQKPVVFLARHGHQSNIPPHKVNYRANIWALGRAGVQKVVAVNAVGGIREDLTPGRLVIPDQIIDYTASRGHTFFEDELSQVVHIDFTHPYCPGLREALLESGQDLALDVAEGGTHGVVQGPRLETAAEIDRLERDGCDIVGMTGMPEAALAREIGLCYATVAVVANPAAGRGPGSISMSEIDANLRPGMKRVGLLLEQVLNRIA